MWGFGISFEDNLNKLPRQRDWDNLMLIDVTSVLSICWLAYWLTTLNHGHTAPGRHAPLGLNDLISPMEPFICFKDNHFRVGRSSPWANIIKCRTGRHRERTLMQGIGDDYMSLIYNPNLKATIIYALLTAWAFIMYLTSNDLQYLWLIISSLHSLADYRSNVWIHLALEAGHKQPSWNK